tara:strand:- start:937 stop:2760 length:1824 start_codon:yes stop_codon:yes gene_type:complete
MAERKTIQDRIRESDLSAFSSIGSPLPGTGVRYDMDNQSTLTPAQTAYLASVFAPGAGITDAAGNFPAFPGSDVPLEEAFSGDPMPSMAENIQAGGIDRYLYAPLQGLGVLGDAAYGIPLVGAGIGGLLKAPGALATVALGISKAGKGSKAAKKGVGSLDQPKDMMFVHNTNENAIKSFDAMGGIPSPSLAVQPADVPLKGFGDIQLIAKPKNFDPSVDPRNAVYSADAYTPRAPKKIRLAKEGAAEQLQKDYTSLFSNKKLMKQAEEGTPPYQIREDIKKAADELNNLQKNNINRPQDRILNFDNFFYTDIARLKFAKETGKELDPTKVNSAGTEYTRWVRKEKDKYLSQDGVFQYFDDFEETMVTKPYTLENATRNMIEETQRGGEAGLMYAHGPNRLRALMTEKMTDLEDIKGQRSRIQDKPYFSSLDDDIEELLENAVDEAPNMQDGMKLSVLRDEGDNLTNQIGMYLDEGDTIEEAVKNAVNYFNVDPAPSLTDDIVNIFKKNAARPTEYLEAKPMRAVGFDEFAGAIVPPKTSQEVIDILENRGLKVIKNNPETDFFKTKARQKFKDQMFSFAPIAGAGGIAALSIDDNTPDENKGVGSLN